MNILWTVNAFPPDVSSKIGISGGHAISWVDAMSKRLMQRKDIKLAMVTSSKTKVLSSRVIDGVKYYILPSDCDKVDYWDNILNDFTPDIIHTYGTEHSHNILLLQNHNEIPILGSLQGILTEYQYHYYGGLDFSTMLKFSKFQDLFTTSGFFSGRKHFIKRSVAERNQLNMLKYVEGRSTWDRVSALNINPNLHYYYCPRMIRESFFKQRWDPETMERHSLFVSQALTPLKGLHFVLMAIAKLKRLYPDIKLYVAGYDRLHPQKFRQKLTCNGYVNYLRHLIKELDVDKQVSFTDILNADQMAERMAKVNAVIIPSSIENAPNSLAEAQIVGTPTIASFVGGNMDMLKHNEEGFLYCYNEPNMLAEYISRIFDSDELAESFSRNGMNTARKRHDPEILERQLIDIYNCVIKVQKEKNNSPQ